MTHSHTFTWENLLRDDQLPILHQAFCTFMFSRTHETAYPSDSITLSLFLEEFLQKVFEVPLPSSQSSWRILFEAKRYLVQRRANPQGDFQAAERFFRHTLGAFFYKDEGALAQAFLNALNAGNQVAIAHAEAYAGWALTSPEGQKRHQNGTLFRLPSQDLSLQPPVPSGRHGFDLTDEGRPEPYIRDQAAYCLKCHERNKDSCRTGYSSEKKGCPLDQKISEMIFLWESGHLLAALAVVLADNPLFLLTGHRICQDCSQACIFQKQTPVDVPEIESRLLRDILSLPYGFELYYLLARWNPLRQGSPLPAISSGHRILVAGLGPAGIGVAHELLNQGHEVWALEGLKVEPLNPNLLRPIHCLSDHFLPLSQRPSQGVGGVAEYGITARWNKNYLLPARLLLERRSHFRLFSGMRLGDTLTIAQAFEDGFDHIVLALGAGEPKFPSLPGVMAKGVRSAAEFLMTLQLGGAQRLDSLTNCVIRLPIIVIGGGLTAIDAATEARAYYPTQVEKFLKLYEDLGNPHHLVQDPLAQTFLEHARLLRQAMTTKDRDALIEEWGGVHLWYRKELHEAPSWRLNLHEIQNALNEGVHIHSLQDIEEILTDDQGWISGVCDTKGQLHRAGSLLFATGTQPNTTSIAQNESDFLSLDGVFFKGEGFVVGRFLDGRLITAIGDLQAASYGSVVKALASAKALAQTMPTLLKKEPYWPKVAPYETPILVRKIMAHDRTILHIHAPTFFRNAGNGHFYKVQNYEDRWKGPANMEGIALHLVHHEPQSGMGIFHVDDKGASSYLARFLEEGKPIFLMGPTGGSTLGPPIPYTAPLGCMMKGLCGSCLTEIEDETGNVTRVYACRHALAARPGSPLPPRLTMNRIQEILTHAWVRRQGFSDL